MKQEKAKSKDKICGICHLVIDDSKQYAQFTHYINKDKILDTAYYHINCYQDKLTGANGLTKIQAMAAQVLNNINQKVGAIA